MSYAASSFRAFERPFRLRYLGAVLARLSTVQDECAIGETVAEWCSREDVQLAATVSAQAARRTLMHEVFAELPSLSLA